MNVDLSIWQGDHIPVYRSVLYTVNFPENWLLNNEVTDGIGDLDGLKQHANIEHTEDDDYLGTLLASARRMVGDVTGWPMRTGRNTIKAVYYDVLPGICIVRLPGPYRAVSESMVVEFDRKVSLRGIQARGTRVRGDFEPDTELPYDGLYLRGPPLNRGSETVDLQIEYTQSWSDIQDPEGPNATGIKWPHEVALTIYRVAATMYLYREATVLGDRPLHRIIQASLGSYLPVEL